NYPEEFLAYFHGANPIQAKRASKIRKKLKGNFSQFILFLRAAIKLIGHEKAYPTCEILIFTGTRNQHVSVESTTSCLAEHKKVMHITSNTFAKEANQFAFKISVLDALIGIIIWMRNNKELRARLAKNENYSELKYGLSNIYQAY